MSASGTTRSTNNGPPLILLRAEALDRVELLLREQAARKAAGGLSQEFVPILVSGRMRFPRLVVAGLAVPLERAAVEVGADLKFVAVSVARPPAEFSTHAEERIFGDVAADASAKVASVS